jgi:glucoamylase
LVWAHAEYIKLLRSVADGRVFDRVSVVEERYAVPKDERKFTSRMEIFQLARPISAMVHGGTLRIVDLQPFQIEWTVDNWETTIHTQSTVIGPPGSFADICIAPDVIGKLIFTLYWPGQDHWLGRNYEVSINASPTPTMPAAVKPKS